MLELWFHRESSVAATPSEVYLRKVDLYFNLPKVGKPSLSHPFRVRACSVNQGGASRHKDRRAGAPPFRYPTPAPARTHGGLANDRFFESNLVRSGGPSGFARHGRCVQEVIHLGKVDRAIEELPCQGRFPAPQPPFSPAFAPLHRGAGNFPFAILHFPC